jgi:hypothetical protein
MSLRKKRRRKKMRSRYQYTIIHTMGVDTFNADGMNAEEHCGIGYISFSNYKLFEKEADGIIIMYKASDIIKIQYFSL